MTKIVFQSSAFNQIPSPTSSETSHDEPAVHGGEEAIEDVGEVEDKDGDDAEPLQVDLELVVEAEEPQVDDYVSECHFKELQNVKLFGKRFL